MAVRDNSSRRILQDDPKTRGAASVEAIHRRRKSAMVALLANFEELIEPLLPSGHEEAIQTFKGVCRKRINALAYEGIRGTQALAGETLSATTVDLAEDLAFDDTEDRIP